MNPVFRAVLIGVVAGMRALTPLAVIAGGARISGSQNSNPIRAWLGRPVVKAGVSALAGGELLGDKWSGAPDRVVPPGLIARASTGAVAAAALSPAESRRGAALVGAGTAIGFAFASLRTRQLAIRRFGQVPTGLVEDAIAVGLALWVVSAGRD